MAMRRIIQRGCDAQAWGVTEALRVWKFLHNPKEVGHCVIYIDMKKLLLLLAIGSAFAHSPSRRDLPERYAQYGR